MFDILLSPIVVLVVVSHFIVILFLWQLHIEAICKIKFSDSPQPQPMTDCPPGHSPMLII